MTWQDIVLSIGSWVFIVALVPSILGKDKPPASTSLLTGGILLIYVAVYYSLHLWVSVVSTGMLGLAWLFLGYQKFPKKSDPPLA